MSAHYLLKAFKAPGIDGDRHGDPRLEQQINYNELLAQVVVDWNGQQLSAVVPNERAMQGVQAEKKVAVARELRDDRPEKVSHCCGQRMLLRKRRPRQSPKGDTKRTRKRTAGTRRTPG